MIKVRKDLTGKKFGKLTVTRQAEDYVAPSGRHYSRWYCDCECGKTDVIVNGQSLTSDNTTSCGCFHNELLSDMNKKNKKKYNVYDLSGNFGIGYTNKGEKFYFDLEDYDKIKDYCWYVGSNGCIVSRNKKGNSLLMHRLIMNATDSSIQVDHIKHKRNDNRKSELRLVDNSKNQMNVNTRKDNTSGHKGVSFHKQTNKWVAYIGINKKNINLGSFSKFEDAVFAREEAEEEYFGEYSYNNSMGIGNNAC